MLGDEYMIKQGLDKINLVGEWRFCLDFDKVGVKKEYYNNRLTDQIILPGTTDENQKGEYNDAVELERLTRRYPYVGVAWYQRDVAIPEEWADKHIQLRLERTRISHLWVDCIDCGEENSICTPHLYDLSDILTPGNHVLTIAVDNENLPIPGGHQTSPDTQTNWNGIVGKLELEATDPVWVEDIQVYPDIHRNNALLKITTGNKTQANANGLITISATGTNCDSVHKVERQEFPINVPPGSSTVEIILDMSKDVLLWDEYRTSLYQLTTLLEVDQKYWSEREDHFGMREFCASGKQFSINSRTIFLRGKTESCVFPLEGYAPMDVEAWVKIFEIAKSYGINHYRFHTCCPPEAGFIAADLTGMYLSPELPFWGEYAEPGGNNYNAPGAEYLMKEGLRILKEYGNHPSFVMFSLGNELVGSRKVMSDFIKKFRTSDKRHLYCEGCNTFLEDPSLSEVADFWVTMRTAKGAAMVRGSFAHIDMPLGHIQTNPPSTVKDYSNMIKGVAVPVISHEIGQYQSYPNYNEIDKYTGVLEPRNLMAFKERIRSRNRLEQADQFFKASGKLSVLCYREEIEAALRTPDFGGLQLLDLQDFPGQGTALIGILDAFMDSKGFIEPKEWREFCSDAVLLARFEKYSYFEDEVFRADIEIAYYRHDCLNDAIVEWSFYNESGMVISGEFAHVDIRNGGNTFLGTVKVSLWEATPPTKLTLELKIKGTDIVNHYSIWIYPSQVNNEIPKGINICRRVEEAESFLIRGEKVLLIPELSKISNGIEGFFASDFWCYPMFRGFSEKFGKPVAPGTLGILCDSNHPALREFPSEFHSNWQWWNIIMNSCSIILDKTPPEFRPIVQVIDNFERNHKLGMVFEAIVSNGQLLICTSDLLSNLDKPEVRQLYYSLIKYMASKDYNPSFKLDFKELKELF